MSDSAAVRAAMGEAAWSELEDRVIRHAVDVMVLGGSLVPIRETVWDDRQKEMVFEVHGFQLRYPVDLGHRIAAAAVVRVGNLERQETPA